MYWQACCSAIRNVINKDSTRPEDIVALCVTGQGETLLCVDNDGKPIHNAIVWLDQRALEESQQIAGLFGVNEIYQITGQPEVLPGWPACKILWLRKNKPDIFKRTAKFLMVEDFLLYRLTGGFYTDCSLQSSSLLLDIKQKTWWPEILDFLGIKADQLGRLVNSGQVIGHLTGPGAEAIGLTTRTVAVSGGMDQIVGAVGAGNVASGVVSEITGGALAILASIDRPLLDPGRRVPCQVHAPPGMYCLMPYGLTAGMALKWFRDQFFQYEAREAIANGLDPYDAMTQLASQVPPGSDDLVVLPHLEGTYCPEFNPAAKAVFFGATLRHTKSHFIRAILESVAFMLKRNLALLESLGTPIRTIYSLGGAARSNLWLQIKADVLQKPITTLQVEEATCLGGAILGATATRQYNTIDEAVLRMVQRKQIIEPDQSLDTVYQRGYDRYVQLYENLIPLFSS
jgi:xylulokinase